MCRVLALFTFMTTYSSLVTSLFEKVVIYYLLTTTIDPYKVNWQVIRSDEKFLKISRKLAETSLNGGENVPWSDATGKRVSIESVDEHYLICIHTLDNELHNISLAYGE